MLPFKTLWFDNNHDGDFSLLGDKINIGGSAYTFTNGGASLDSFTTSSYSVSAGSPFVISYNNEEFYLSKMTASAVPEPATILLTGAGLLSLAFAKRRRKEI